MCSRAKKKKKNVFAGFLQSSSAKYRISIAGCRKLQHFNLGTQARENKGNALFSSTDWKWC